MVDFPEYPNVLIRMLNNCIKEPHSHLAVFVIEREGLARLDFIQVQDLCARSRRRRLARSNCSIRRVGEVVADGSV